MLQRMNPYFANSVHIMIALWVGTRTISASADQYNYSKF